MVSAEYTAAELADAAGITMRNLRAYRQRGLLEPPRMHGRKGYYGPEHLAQLRTVRALLARGLSLAEITAMVHERGGQAALDLLLTEPGAESATADGRLGALMISTLETLALQRPGAPGRLVELGVLQQDAKGRYLGDGGMLARANELLATGSRVRVIADVAEAAAIGGQTAGDALLKIATDNGSAEPRAYIDLATWSFREALRHRLTTGATS
jgi:DNA-binding transcriptional MerR regulator